MKNKNIPPSIDAEAELVKILSKEIDKSFKKYFEDFIYKEKIKIVKERLNKNDKL